jgi:Xaa-Pro aminopeptidase
MTVTEILPDDAALRGERRARVLEAMEAADFDVLVVGREANARYVSGAPRLWTAGSRAFGPGCVIVRATGAVHLLSTWDEGVPDDIPHENLYGITFNTTNFVTVLQGMEGTKDARRVATDGLTPGFAKLLPMAFPTAELIDGEDVLRRVRAVKGADEIAAIRASVRRAEHALDAAELALVPGITERQLTAVFMEAMASAGITTPASQDVAWITSRTSPWQRASRDAAAADGDLVAFEAGVVAGGYAGELARTRVVGDGPLDPELSRQWNDLRERLMTACRPGAPATDLLDAYAAAGVGPPPVPVARGLGLGFDLPLVTHALPRTAADQRLEAGMVLALTTYVWKEGVGALYGQEPLVVTADGPELLSTDPLRDARSPLA